MLVRFRFVAPEIARGMDAARGHEEIAGDFDQLCTTLALPYLAGRNIDAQAVVISLADQAFTFGERRPDVTQYYERYSLKDGRCVWEGF